MSGFKNKGTGSGGTISRITSTGDTVTITDPTGPTTDLEVAAGGSGTVTAVSSPDNSLAVATGTTTPKLTGGVPAGDRTKIATPITYTDPISGDAIEVLTLSEETTAIAIGRAGQAFPQLVFRPAGSFADDSTDAVLGFGDGTFDPAAPDTTTNGFSLSPSIGTASGPNQAGWVITTPNSFLYFNQNNGNVGGSTQVEQLAIAPTQYAQGSGAPINVLVAEGNPNTLVLESPYSGTGLPGNLNDLYINTAATGDDDWLWRCSIAGGIGAATWVGKL